MKSMKTKRRFKGLFYLALMIGLSFGLFLVVMNGQKARAAWSGSGTEADPYLIGTAQELEEFSDILGGNPSACAKLTSDIDYNAAWEPMASFNGRYSGVFDGNNKYINITVSSRDYSGLFSFIENATIKNLTIKGEISGDYCAGAIASNISGTTVISNCTNMATISSPRSAGGIVGQADSGQIIGCTNEGNITKPNTMIGEGIATGGIVGRVAKLDSANQNVTISLCTNKGDVKATENNSYCGGIIGRCDDDLSTTVLSIDNCCNAGSIEAGSYVGGIAGYNRGAISYCVNYGEIKQYYSSNTYGAIYGECTDYPDINHCYYLEHKIIVNGVTAIDYEGYKGSFIAGNPLNANAMRYQTSFVDFNFEEYWGIVGDYPALIINYKRFKLREEYAVGDSVYVPETIYAVIGMDPENIRNDFPVGGFSITSIELGAGSIIFEFSNGWSIAVNDPYNRQKTCDSFRVKSGNGTSANPFTFEALFYVTLNPEEKPTINKPEEPSVGDEIYVETAANPIEVEWYYADEAGNPTGNPIDTGWSHTIEKEDVGKRIVAVVKQTEDESGNPITENIPTAITDSFFIQGHTHDDIVYNAWKSTNSLPTEAGDYYLANDVTLSSTWNVPAGETNLCLNGHGIRMTGSTRVIYLNGATLSLFDCDTTTVHKYTIPSPIQGAGLAVVNDEATGDGVKTFVGGYITGANTSDRGGVVSIEGGSKFVLNGGTLIGNTTSAGHGGGAVALLGYDNNQFIMNGGALIGNTTSGGWGGAIYMHEGASFTMNGGVIKENYAAKSGNGAGGGISAEGSGSIIMTGGEIVNNVAQHHGGNINFANNIQLSGIIKIAGGKNSSGNNDNIDVNGTRVLNIAGALDENSSISLTTSNVKFTSGWSTYMADANPKDYFVSDVDGKYFGFRDGEAALFDTPQRVHIGDSTYSTLQEAHDACNDNDVIVLMQDYERETEFGKLECDKTITIDLNGFIIKDFDYTVQSISANHNLTIDNSNPEIGGVKGLLSITSDRVSGKIILKNIRIDADKEMMEIGMEEKPFINFADGFNIFDFSPSSPDYAEGFMGIIMEYSALNPTGKPTVSNPDHTPVYIGEEITIDVDAAPVEIKWYYVDGDGKPTGEPIGTGKTYKPKSPEDLGKKVVAVIKQYYDENGNPITGNIPTQISDPIHVYTPLDPTETEKPVIKTSNDKERPGNGDVIEVDGIGAKPTTVKWYYDDDGDGQPDGEAIGTGPTYTIKAPDSNDPTHDDTGHNIIAVIKQDKKPDGTDYQEDEKPTITSNPIKTKGYLPGEYKPLDVTENPAPKAPNHTPLVNGDELTIETDASDVIIKWYYTDSEGKPTGEAIGTGPTYTIKAPDQNDSTHDDRDHNIIAVIKQKYDQNGDDYLEEQMPTQYSTIIADIITKHQHNFTYKASGNKITATCGNPDCTITTGLTLTLVAPTGDMISDGKPRVATIQAGYNEEVFPNPVIKYYLDDKEVTSCVNAGTYVAKVTIGTAVAKVTFTIKPWELVDPESKGAKVEIEGVGKVENISVKIEVKTTINAESSSTDYDLVKAKLGKDEKITKVYEVRLIQTVNGVEKEIQPSDIKEGTKIKVTMSLSEEVLNAESFKILHIHSANDTEFIEDYTVSGNTVSFEVSRLSEFAFIIKDTGLSGWGIAFIVIDSFVLALAIAYVLSFFAFNKWIMINGTPVRVIKCGKKGDKTVVITLFLTVEYRNDNEIFDNKEKALKA